MTDRLPAPLVDEGSSPLAERASATPARAARRIAAKPHLNVPAACPRSLHDVERWLVSAISGSEGDAEAAPLVVTPGPRLSARERLEIYRDAYRARLVECLVDDYPVLSQTLGTDRFETFATGYIDRFPSSSPSLNAFGRHMARWCLEGAPSSLESRREFLCELARLEWAIVEAIHAPDGHPFDPDALRAVPPDKLADARLEDAGTVQVLRFQHPVNAFFQKVRVSGEPAEIPGPAPSATAVYRRGLVVWRMDLTPAMTRVLEALLAGRSIGDALGTMGVNESEPGELAEAERSVMVWFKEWIVCGFFSRIL